MKILFLCVANSARSQLAEGLAREILREDEIESAGSMPTRINPVAVAVMREIGLDISNQYSKSVQDLPPEFVDQVDYVITLCAEEVCPIMISKARRLHWPHPDPTSNEMFRVVRDGIQERLHAFKKELGR